MFDYKETNSQEEFNNYVEECYDISEYSGCYQLLTDLDQWVSDLTCEIKLSDEYKESFYKQGYSEMFECDFGSALEDRLYDMKKFKDYCETYLMWLEEYYNKKHYEYGYYDE